MQSLRRYRVERLTKLFVTKLKQTAVLNQTPKELQGEQLHLSFLERCLGDAEGIESSSIWNKIIQIASSLAIVWLMILYSLTSVFGEL
jgi:hypothetical protein